jgi:exodeoxyribonuclease V alpha subunit
MIEKTKKNEDFGIYLKNLSFFKTSPNQILPTEPTEGSPPIKVQVLQVIFHSPETCWTVLKCKYLEKELEQPFVCVGSFAHIVENSIFYFFGRWVEHKQFGKQFKVERATEARPSTQAGIISYLASGLYPGIGKGTATRLANHFGENIFQVIDETPEKLYEAPKIRKKVIHHFLEQWQDKRKEYDLLMLLSKHGITGALMANVLKTYENQDLLQILTETPYRLIRDVPRVGFLTADRIALSVGITPTDPHRLEEGILHILDKASDEGHCYQELETLGEKTKALLKREDDAYPELLENSLGNLKNQRRLILEKSDLYYLRSLFWAEKNVTQAVLDLAQTPLDETRWSIDERKTRVTKWLDSYTAQQKPLSKEQRQAVELAANSSFFILTGGPGVGKTTTANAMIHLFRSMGLQVNLTAPTGRAAQRISEVSQTPAKTIHRLLEWNPVTKSFTKNKDNPIVGDVLLIDETSMVDIRLAECLFLAISKKTQVILLGDVDQLPSVGPGNVLGDLIGSQKFPTVHLKEIFRQAQSSRIISYAHMINRGQMPAFDNAPGSDCHFIPLENAEDIQNCLMGLVQNHLPGLNYHITRDIQILSPMNRGDLGSGILNQKIQSIANPPGVEKPEYRRLDLIFRVGDKVIQTVNNYDLAVFNGDIGFIVQIENKNQVTVEFPTKTVKYTTDEHLNQLSLAYCITIHKSQGSEFPVVIIPLATSHYMMLQRNLVYTGLTRGKKLVIFVGQKKALEIAVSRRDSQERRTLLKERLGGS